MKGLVKYINESSHYSKKDYGALGRKWYDKCYNLSIAGSFNWTEPRLSLNDFNGFIDDFEKMFKMPTDDSRWSEKCRARMMIGEFIRNGKIDEVGEYAREHEIERFTYGAHPEADFVYGSYFLDCYLVLVTYEYITNGNLIIRNNILNSIFNIDNSMYNWEYDWCDSFADKVRKLYNSVPGNK